MSTAIMQPQPNGELWIVDEIVRFGSNTEEVVTELERRFWRSPKQLTIYPDPAGGYRQHARGETDLDIFRERGFTRIQYRRKHPPVADRVNSVNRMLLAGDGTIRLRVDGKCKEVINSFEQTVYRPGGREIDKSAGAEHITDAIGYCVEFQYPLRSLELLGISI